MRQVNSEPGHVSLSRLNRHARLQTADSPEDLRPSLRQVGRFAGYRGPDERLVGRQRKLEPGRQDGYDRMRLTVETDLLVQDRFIAAESTLPVLVADDRYGLTAALLFFNCKITPTKWFDLEHGKEVRANSHALNLFGLSVL